MTPEQINKQAKELGYVWGMTPDGEPGWIKEKTDEGS